MGLSVISPEHLRGFSAIWSMDPHAQREKVSPYALQGSGSGNGITPHRVSTGTLGHVIGETSATGINPGSTTPTNAPSGVTADSMWLVTIRLPLLGCLLSFVVGNEVDINSSGYRIIWT